MDVLSADASKIEVHRLTTVRGGSLKKGSSPWNVCLESVGGVEFVELSKRDYGFSRFVTGTNRDLQKLPLFNTLKYLRTAACQKVAFPADEDNALFEATAQPKKKQRKGDIVKDDMPPWVNVKLPGFCTDEGEEIPELSVKFVFTLDAAAAPKVEFTQRTLAFIRLALLASKEDDHDSSPTQNAKGLYWKAFRGTCGAWVAVRKEDSGKQKCKQFKVSDSSMPAKRTAKADAEAWLLEDPEEEDA